jgi:hypothetical protein
MYRQTFVDNCLFSICVLYVLQQFVEFDSVLIFQYK